MASNQGRTAAALAREGGRRRLLYLVIFDPHVPVNGSGARSAQLINHLARRFDVDLLYMQGTGHKIVPGLAERGADRVRGTLSQTSVPFGKLAYFVYSRTFHRKARELMRRHAYDIIYCDYGLCALYGVLLSREFKVPFAYGSDNVEFLGNVDKAKEDPRRVPLIPYMYAVERAGVKRCRLLVPITDSDAAFYERWAPREKMIVVPQGFDPAELNPFYAPPRNDRPVILFCGDFGVQFNRDGARAFAKWVLPKVASRRPDARFMFVGANPPPRPPHPKMEFTGFVDDYFDRLKSADVVISPLLQGRGFPTKIVEALACGKPTVATPVGARAVEKDHAALHVCGFRDFADTLLRVLERNAPVTTADFEKLKERYSWSANINKLADRLEQCIEATVA